VDPLERRRKGEIAGAIYEGELILEGRSEQQHAAKAEQE